MRLAGGILLACCWLCACGRGDSEALPYWRALNALDDARPDIARSELEEYLERAGETGERAAAARRALARSWSLGAFQSPGRAEPLWRSLLDADPSDREVRLGLARSLLQLGRASEARELLAGGAGEHGESGDELLGAALLETDPGRALELATGRMAARPQAALLAAKAAELLGDEEATLEHAQRAVLTQPLNPAAHYLLSRSLQRSGELERAQAVAQRHRDAMSLEARGSATQESALERLRALERIEAALPEPTPEVGALRIDLAIEAGLKEEGRRLLDEALATPSRFAATPSRLAAWAERLGDLKRAATLLESALSAESDAEVRRQFQHRLGRLYRARDPERAREFLREALAEQPHVARFHCALASLAVAAEQIETALESYRRALQLAPWRADCRVEFARLLHVERAGEGVEELLAQAPEPAPELVRFGKEFGYVAP